MTPEHDAELRRRYPLVFAGPLLNDEPIRCGDGWFFLLDMLCRNLQRLIEREPETERARYRAAQVKEKFGTLRFYLDQDPADPTHPITGEIAGAVWASALFCDVCGKPGQLRTLTDKAPLVATRCDEHNDLMRRP
jgi:hypothetical protein